MRKAAYLSLSILGASLALTISAARADAIDGDWCHPDGRRLSIDGASIVTPGGKRMTGNYGRHDFSYVVPAPEPSAGQNIAMQLLSEEAMNLRVGAGAPQLWQRCKKPVS